MVSLLLKVIFTDLVYKRAAPRALITIESTIQQFIPIFVQHPQMCNCIFVTANMQSALNFAVLLFIYHCNNEESSNVSNKHVPLSK